MQSSLLVTLLVMSKKSISLNKKSITYVVCILLSFLAVLIQFSTDTNLYLCTQCSPVLWLKLYATLISPFPVYLSLYHSHTVTHKEILLFKQTSNVYCKHFTLRIDFHRI